MDALHALQVEHAGLRQQLTDADIAAMDLRYQNMRLRQRRGGANAPAEDVVPAELLAIKELEKLVDFVNQCARKYACLHCPWVDDTLLEQLTSEHPPIEPNDPLQRLPESESPVSAALARLAEIFRLLAANPNVKALLGRAEWIGEEVRISRAPWLSFIITHFFIQFRWACLDQKCKYINKVIKQGNYVLLEHHLEPARLDTAAERKNYPALQAIGARNSEDIYCPVMYPVGHVGEPAYLFKCHAILAVRSSLDCLFSMSNKPPGNPSGTVRSILPKQR